jgi:hypothetical protein
MIWGLRNLPGWSAPVARSLSPELIGYGIAYAGLLADVAIPLLLLRGRTFWFGFGLAAVFHALNAAFLQIGVFSYLMTGAILIFLPPDWPRRLRRSWASTAGRRIPARLRLTLAELAEPAPGSVEAPASWSASRRLVATLLGLYVAIQLLVPLRHFLYPGPVSWTEEGHRFAWHMKLRMKYSLVRITITDPATGASSIVNPRHELTVRQARKLETFPDILLQYVHILRDRRRREGVDPEIRVDWRCSLNGRPMRALVDPEVNLAAVERTWRPATWILPLEGGRSTRLSPDRTGSGGRRQSGTAQGGTR